MVLVDISVRMNRDLDILKEAKRRGWNGSRLTAAQYTKCAFHVRSLKEKVADGSKALGSRLATTTRMRVVSLPQAMNNQRQCETNECGRFDTLADGEPVCRECNCAGKYLRSKWKDAKYFCPFKDPKTGKEKPFWDNRTKPSEEEKGDGN